MASASGSRYLEALQSAGRVDGQQVLSVPIKVAAALSHAELEDSLDTRGRELLRRMFQDHLSLSSHYRDHPGLSADSSAGPDLSDE